MGIDTPQKDSRKNPIILICHHNSIIQKALSSWLSWYEFQVLPAKETATDRWNDLEKKRPKFLIIEFDTVETLDFIRKVKAEFPGTEIVVHSNLFQSSRYFYRLQRAGVSGFVLKISPYTSWIYALQEINDGKRYVDPLLLSLINKSKKTIPVLDRMDINMEVLRRIELGTGEISEELLLDTNEVEQQLTLAMEALNLPTKTAIALRLLDAGIILLPKLPGVRDIDTGKTTEENDELECAKNAMNYLGQHPWNLSTD